MQNNFIAIWNFVNQYVNVPYLFTFMALAYMIKAYFQLVLAKILKRVVPFVYVVLTLATVVAIPYLLSGASFDKVLFAYAIGTSMHEILFKWIEKKIKKVTGPDPVIIIKYLPADQDKPTHVDILPTVSPQLTVQPEATPVPQPETPAQ